MNVKRWIANPLKWVSMDTMSCGDWWKEGSATYGNAKWELGSQLNKFLPGPRNFLNIIWIWGFWKFNHFNEKKMWSVKLWNIHMLFYHLSGCNFLEFTTFLLHVTMKVHSMCQAWLPNIIGNFKMCQNSN